MNNVQNLTWLTTKPTGPAKIRIGVVDLDSARWNITTAVTRIIHIPFPFGP